MRFIVSLLALFLLFSVDLKAQQVQATDARMYDIIEASSKERLERDIRTLADFGTRNTFSDTTSSSRGIGAARRWIFKEFEAISSQCGGCLEVSYQRSFIEKSSSSRANEDVWVVNVLAVQRGKPLSQSVRTN